MDFSELDLIATYVFNDRSPLLIDVGAHHGIVSRLFAQRGWNVIAFEPEDKNRMIFEQNLANFENVRCIAKAVSDITGGKVPFYISDEHYGIHSLKPFHRTHRLAYEVSTTRIDDILSELQVPSVTLLKVDTEGADFLALQGFDFGRYHPELIMVEFMDSRSLPNFGYNHHDVVKYMKEQGYITFVSEWQPIQEYAREGVCSPPHDWIQCVIYPLDHEPAWGNLLCVPKEDRLKFEHTLKHYLYRLKCQKFRQTGRSLLKKVPGVRKLYHVLHSKKVFR